MRADKIIEFIEGKIGLHQGKVMTGDPVVHVDVARMIAQEAVTMAFTAAAEGERAQRITDQKRIELACIVAAGFESRDTTERTIADWSLNLVDEVINRAGEDVGEI